MYLQFLETRNGFKIETVPSYNNLNSTYYIEYSGYDLRPLVDEYFETRGRMTEDDVKELCYIHKKSMELLVNRPDKVKKIFATQLPILMFYYVNVKENLTYVNKLLSILNP